MSTHPHYMGLIKRLNLAELELIDRFIKSNIGANRDEFVIKVNRMFIGVESKPKNWTLIQEILTVIG